MLPRLGLGFSLEMLKMWAQMEARLTKAEKEEIARMKVSIAPSFHQRKLCGNDQKLDALL